MQDANSGAEPNVTPLSGEGETEDHRYSCPECGGWVAAPDDASGSVIVCPSCNAQFFPPTDSDLEMEESPGGQPDDGAIAYRDPTEVDGIRIRQLSALRRGAYRTRSYCIVAAGGLIVAAVKLAVMTVRQVRYAGWHPRPIGYVFAIISAVIGAGFVVQRIMELNYELKQSGLPEPTEPPDFSTLSDGSQQWKNLEEM